MAEAENILQQQAIRLMTSLGFLSWRNSSIPVRGRKNTVKPGISDVICVGFGSNIYFIECKGPNAKHSPPQIEFQKEVEKRGCTYILMKKIEDLEEALRERKLIV